MTDVESTLMIGAQNITLRLNYIIFDIYSRFFFFYFFKSILPETENC